MLAPTPYLTAADLGLTEDENWALSEIQRRLECGELKHGHIDHTMGDKEPLECFNMKFSHCGTAACIGGWMAVVLGRSHRRIAEFVSNHERLHELFYPLDGEDDNQDWEKITVKQAVTAIKYFRMTGNANEAWTLALT